MKKLIVFLVIFFAAVSLFADPIQLGNFPVGQWLDANYDAVWDFSSSNIRILSTSGVVLYDFSTKTINDFRVFLDGSSPGISFTCPEAGRSYRFVKPLANTTVILGIERTGLPAYSVTMQRQ
jgi:hypothetical protein